MHPFASISPSLLFAECSRRIDVAGLDHVNNDMLLVFDEIVFEYLDLDFKEFVKYDENLERPAEVDLLIGNPLKAKKQLGWEPKTSTKDLAKLMVDSDMKLAEQERLLLNQL